MVALWAICYYMLGGNLGSLLYGDVFVMQCAFSVTSVNVFVQVILQ